MVFLLLITSALRFFLRNPYESLVIVNKEGRFGVHGQGIREILQSS